MPTYDYHCTECHHRMEAFQKITEAPLEVCPHCHKPALKRGPGGGIGLSFVGTGWYKTDYAPQTPPASGPTESKPANSCCPCGKNKGSCSS